VRAPVQRGEAGELKREHDLGDEGVAARSDRPRHRWQQEGELDVVVLEIERLVVHVGLLGLPLVRVGAIQEGAAAVYAQAGAGRSGRGRDLAAGVASPIAAGRRSMPSNGRCQRGIVSSEGISARTSCKVVAALSTIRLGSPLIVKLTPAARPGRCVTSARRRPSYCRTAASPKRAVTIRPLCAARCTRPSSRRRSSAAVSISRRPVWLRTYSIAARRSSRSTAASVRPCGRPAERGGRRDPRAGWRESQPLTSVAVTRPAGPRSAGDGCVGRTASRPTVGTQRRRLGPKPAESLGYQAASAGRRLRPHLAQHRSGSGIRPAGRDAGSLLVVQAVAGSSPVAHPPGCKPAHRGVVGRSRAEHAPLPASLPCLVFAREGERPRSLTFPRKVDICRPFVANCAMRAAPYVRSDRPQQRVGPGFGPSFGFGRELED
jgi:hypothetical protein